MTDGEKNIDTPVQETDVTAAEVTTADREIDSAVDVPMQDVVPAVLVTVPTEVIHEDSGLSAADGSTT